MAGVKDEFEYYLEHQNELVEQYNGKYLVIKDHKVQEVFDAELDAYGWATERFEAGTFLIQQCLPGDEAYSQTFYSRVCI